MGNHASSAEAHEHELAEQEKQVAGWKQDGHGGIDEPVVVWSTRFAKKGGMENYMKVSAQRSPTFFYVMI